MARVGVVVAAAGEASRMRGEDKLFADLAGRPVLAWCIDTFESCRDVVSIVVAMNESNIAAGRALGCDRGWTMCRFCLGGARRQDSVSAALTVMDEVDCVVVHDGDRPFVTPRMVEEGVYMVSEVDVAVAAVPSKDTIKVVDDGNNVLDTPERSSLRLVQTPQVVRADVIRSVYRGLADDVTDDASLAERRGCRVRVYDGAYDNIKITTPEDLVVARAIAEYWSAGA